MSLSIVRVLRNSTAYTKRLFDHGKKYPQAYYSILVLIPSIYDDAFKNY